MNDPVHPLIIARETLSMAFHCAKDVIVDIPFKAKKLAIKAIGSLLSFFLG